MLYNVFIKVSEHEIITLMRHFTLKTNTTNETKKTMEKKLSWLIVHCRDRFVIYSFYYTHIYSVIIFNINYKGSIF